MNMYLINSIGFDISKIDELAVTIFVVGFGIVFLSLIVIASFFIGFSKIVVKYENDRIAKSQSNPKIVKAKNTINKEENEEIYAAIAMAVNLYSGKSYDDEPLVLTININDGLNSQWSSKVQNIANF